ncbi:MAG: IS110 family transposase [Bacteroidetes bacterium]|nr:IS110 family transposase [Bacteroidota bacterium]
MTTRTVGIDLAIRGLHVAHVLDGDGQSLGSPIRFRAEVKDLEQLVARVRAGLGPSDVVQVVMEPTGMSWFPVALWLQKAGCVIIRVKGKRVKALRRYLSEHVKSDLSDADLLGRIPRFGQHGLVPQHIPSAAQHALGRLTKQRRRYTEEICSIRRRVRDLIRWAHPSLEHALPELSTQVSRAILLHYLNPRKMTRLGAGRLAAFIRANVGGNHPVHGDFAENVALRLIAAARETSQLYRDDEVDYDLLQLEISQEIQRWEGLREHIKALDEQIERLYRDLDPSAHLRSIPGIGPLLGPSLLGVVHDWTRFGSQRRLRGFCGLFPKRNESGGVTRPGQKIGKGGSNRAKRDLILAADVARTVDPGLAQVYYRMMVDKGKHHRQALCAVATRLVNRIHMVLKQGRPYELRDLDGRPITVAEAKALIESHFTVPRELRQARTRCRRATG